MYKRKTMKNIIRYAIFLLTASITFAQGNSKLARDLDGFHPGEKVDVIVQFQTVRSSAKLKVPPPRSAAKLPVNSVLPTSVESVPTPT